MLLSVTDTILTVFLIILAILLLICMVKTVVGPRVGDRIVCINMMGTIVMAIIAILAVKMQEGFLVDICLIYAMISFLALVVLCRIYLEVYKAGKEKEESENAE